MLRRFPWCRTSQFVSKRTFCSSISPSQKSIYVFGTFDTKGEEITYLSKTIKQKLTKWNDPLLLSSNSDIKLVDISTQKCITYSNDNNRNNNSKYFVDYTPYDIINDFDSISKLNRNDSIVAMTQSLNKFIISEYNLNRIAGVVSMGGSCGTSIASSIFTNNLPLGLPKMIISTLASSTMCESLIGSSDLILVPSIVDIAGINDITKIIIENVSSSIVSMSQNYITNEIENKYKNKDNNVFTVAITMFGITTECVNYIRDALDTKYGNNINTLIFHATGAGGKCMEYLIKNGYVDGVIDLTTTEVADYSVGGILSCNEFRFDSACNANIPTIISLGAANTVNFGEFASISSTFSDDKQRVWHPHNEKITLMKANDNELKDIAKFISSKINKYKDNKAIKMVIPQKGISALDAVDSTSKFAEYGLNDLDTLTTTLQNEINDKNILKYVDSHINDQSFALNIVNEFENILNSMNIKIDNTKTQKITNIPQKTLKTSSSSSLSRRETILNNFYKQISSGIPIIGAGAGTGISAKCEVMGGADLIIIYNSGKYRMAGRGSLAGLLSFGDANKIVLDMANEVLPIVKQQNNMIPVLAGVNGTDPFRDMDQFLSTIKSMGFDGVQNFPTVGLIDGKFRQNLEETGFGYDKEINMMDIAKNKYDLITTPYVHTINEALLMSSIGVDIIVIHLGLTTGGNIGAKTTEFNLDDSIDKIINMSNAVYSINQNIILLVHGGPIANPDDVEYIINNLPKGTIDGFYGASSMERLPVETSITDRVKQFKDIKLI